MRPDEELSRYTHGQEELDSLEDTFKSGTLPVSVEILTPDYEIRGIVYVSRQARDERRLTELLNETGRRFLAVTDVEIISRIKPSTVRRYAFLQLHLNHILMLHPASQTLLNESGYSRDEACRFNRFRAKMNDRGF